jgi:hypothetical protein
MEGMEAEHCSMPDSLTKFKTSNYGILTCPSEEWRIIKKCDKSFETKEPFERVIPNYQELRKSSEVQLEDAEIIAVILYTGPMVSFVLV